MRPREAVPLPQARPRGRSGPRRAVRATHAALGGVAGEPPSGRSLSCVPVAQEVTILLVDDEESVQKLLAFPLEREGFHVVQARDGEEALERFDENDVDLVILDVMLPKLDGLEVCRRLRAMLPAASARSDVLEVDGLEIDVPRRAVAVRGEPVQLTYLEFELLRMLAANPGRVYTRETLLSALRGGSQYRDPRTIDVHVRHLREKIERDPRNPEYVFTVRGVGYRFRDSG